MYKMCVLWYEALIKCGICQFDIDTPYNHLGAQQERNLEERNYVQYTLYVPVYILQVSHKHHMKI